MRNELGKTLAEIFNAKYTIPLYQRNFAWRTDEVQQLLQDVYDAFRANPNGNYYIGSLVVMKRHAGDYEVIDGQQRLTVISMIAILLGKMPRPVLSYDSRPEVQNFFNALCEKAEDALRMPYAVLYYLKEAYNHIKNARVDSPNLRECENKRFLDVDGIGDFIMRHVVLVRNEIPEDTDVAAYFEIMNNRGAQLRKHEIVKARMLDKIKFPDGAYDMGKQQQFANVWDACSQMDIPIQRSFPVPERRCYFGDKYDSFGFIANNTGERREKKSYSIINVLDEEQDLTACNADVSDDAEIDVYNYDSIIDFSNFLMHVLRLYVNKHAVCQHCGVDDVPLNEKELLSVYNQLADKIDSMEFIKLLLFCRTAFDRFVVKTISDTADQEDGQRWMLIKPKQYGKSWKYVDSFGVSGKGLVVKAISLLQVTFRARVYKQWLFETLSWLYDECFSTGDFATISPSRYLGFLHGYMLEYYKKQAFNIPIVGENDNLTPETTYARGTDTPHFLLNFIDYLYWCDSEKRAKYAIKDFEFKYWNSVEHHLAQNKGEGRSYIDNLGNLCLVSKSSNSRLSDRDVKEKVQSYGKGNLGPNRQVIYAMTESGDTGEKWTWGECQIRDHYIEVSELLDRREELLGQCQGKSNESNMADALKALGEFIERHFFGEALQSGFSVRLSEGDDAESSNKWCGRYFQIEHPNKETVRCWVGWRYGGKDKIAYGKELDFSVSPSFVIQIPPESFRVDGSVWYKTIWIGKWRNKELSSFDILDRDSWSLTAEEFKREIAQLCEIDYNWPE